MVCIKCTLSDEDSLFEYIYIFGRSEMYFIHFEMYRLLSEPASQYHGVSLDLH